MTHKSLAELEEGVGKVLTPTGTQWLDGATITIANQPSAIRSRFPAVTRTVGHIPFDNSYTDDAVRVLLLAVLGEHAAQEVPDLYRYGDANERRAVLLSLDYLRSEVAGMSLVRDALRTNDVHLVTAALGNFALEHLSEDELRQAVMKCVFMDIPLADIADVSNRTSPELSQMLAGFVLERIAAGRSIHPDLWPLIDAYPPITELAVIENELNSPFEDRRQAAVNALSLRNPC